MAKLDFAFMAEFAKIEVNATITAVGAGIRGVGVAPRMSGSIGISLAGAVDRERGEGAATLAVVIEPPNHAYSIGPTSRLEPAPAQGDFATTVFAVRLEFPFVGHGKYEVKISINDEHQQTLELWVTETTPSTPTVGA
jgi:hypothetical protein